MKCITLKGAPFEIGEELGRHAKPAARFIKASIDNGAGLVPEGRSLAAQQMVRVEEEFPDYWEELRGMSKGLGLDMRDVFLWNCWPDIAGQEPTVSNTIAINRLGYRLVLHNLQQGSRLARGCMLVDVMPDGKPGYLSLYVPGRLPGSSFGANRAGVVHAVNHIVGDTTGAGLPGFIVGRAVLNARSFPDAIDTVMGCGGFGAAHHVLACAQEFIMLGISVVGKERQIEPIPNKHWHTNHFVRQNGVTGAGTGAWAASHQRYLALERLMAHLPSHPDEGDILGILENTQGNSGMPCDDASGILPVEGEIGTVLMKILPQRIELNLFPPAQAGSKRYVVTVDCTKEETSTE